MTMDMPPPNAPPQQHIGCAGCGYNLFGLAIDQFCPECGRAISLGFGNLTTSGKAITSMVLGIISIVSCMAYGVPAVILGGLAIIFAKLARNDILEGRVSQSSTSFAKAGNVCGIIGLSLGSVYVVGMVVLIFMMMRP